MSCKLKISLIDIMPSENSSDEVQFYQWFILEKPNHVIGQLWNYLSTEDYYFLNNRGVQNI